MEESLLKLYCYALKKLYLIAVIFKFFQKADSKIPVNFRWITEHLMISPLTAFVTPYINNVKSNMT